MGSLCSVLSFIFLDNEREVVNVIEFDNVSKTYANGTEALKNVSLRIEDGEFVFIVGSSGAGKSTFLKIMMREQVPNKGTVIINGFNLNKLKKKQIPMFRRTLGIVFQDFRLIPNMTVYDNVAFAMRVIGAKEKEIRKRVPYILSLVGLSSKARQKPNQLSGGEQQRVALARALVNNAGLIIADEPTGNIDPEMSYEIVDLLNHINASGRQSLWLLMSITLSAISITELLQSIRAMLYPTRAIPISFPTITQNMRLRIRRL